MKIVTASYARNNLQEVINTAVYQNTDIILTKHGVPLVVIKPYKEQPSQRELELALKPALKLRSTPTKEAAQELFREAKENHV